MTVLAMKEGKPAELEQADPQSDKENSPGKAEFAEVKWRLYQLAMHDKPTVAVQAARILLREEAVSGEERPDEDIMRRLLENLESDEGDTAK